MRFRLVYAVIGALSTVLLLGACGSSDPAPAPPSPSGSVSVSSSGSPSPTVATAPLLPTAAKAHTKEGAEAFVRHFWAVVNYAQETGDTEPLSVLSADGCKACEAGIAGIRKVYSDSGRFVGGRVSITRLSGEIRQAGQQRFAAVRATVTEAAEFLDFADDSKDAHVPATTYDETFDLIAVSSGWLVGQIAIRSKK